MFVDTHAHLTYSDLSENLEAVLERANLAGVKRIINIATDLESSESVIKSSIKFDNGLLSSESIQRSANLPLTGKDIAELLTLPKVVAVGENRAGLFRIYSPKEKQIEVFGAVFNCAGIKFASSVA
jgi:TatD DNase family protein